MRPKGTPIRCALLLINWKARIKVSKFKKDLNCREGEENRHTPNIYANLDTDISWLKPHFNMNGDSDREWGPVLPEVAAGPLSQGAKARYRISDV
jgi:hypothetical protein